MNVEALREGALQLRNVGDVRQHAQLDLRVVRRDQHRALGRDERRADLAAFLGADRNVLQIGVVGRQAPRGGRSQRIAGVDAAAGGVDEAGQRVGIGRAQLRQLAPLQHRVDEAPRIVRQLLVGGEIVEQSRPRFPLAALGALAARKLQAVEQQFTELLRRAEIEFLADETVDLLFEPGDRLRERGSQTAQHAAVDENTRGLHLGQAPARAAVRAFRRR